MADFGTVVDGGGAATAKPNWESLRKLDADKTITTKLLYIDFSAQISRFMENSTVDEMATAIVDRIANNTMQQERGYSFVYPVVQSFWDSTGECRKN